MRWNSGTGFGPGQGRHGTEAPRRHRHQHAIARGTRQRFRNADLLHISAGSRAGAADIPSRRRPSRNCFGPGRQHPGSYVGVPASPALTRTRRASTTSSPQVRHLKGRPWRRVAWPASPVRQRPLRSGRRRPVAGARSGRLALRDQSLPSGGDNQSTSPAPRACLPSTHELVPARSRRTAFAVTGRCSSHNAVRHLVFGIMSTTSGAHRRPSAASWSRRPGWCVPVACTGAAC